MRLSIAYLLILLAVVGATFLLSGCAQIAGVLPSMQHCQRVSYEREGNAIELSASCTAPIGGSLM